MPRSNPRQRRPVRRPVWAGQPSHWYGDRARYRVHDDRGRTGGSVGGAGRPVAHADIDGTGWCAGRGGRSHHRRGQVSEWRCTTRTTRTRTTRSPTGRGVRRTARHRVAARDRTPEPRSSLRRWIWRYDLEATSPSRTTVTLTYDWSSGPAKVREYLHVPAVGQGHLATRCSPFPTSSPRCGCPEKRRPAFTNAPEIPESALLRIDCVEGSRQRRSARSRKASRDTVSHGVPQS